MVSFPAEILALYYVHIVNLRLSQKVIIKKLNFRIPLTYIWRNSDEDMKVGITETSHTIPNPDKPEKILQFLHISSTIKKNVGGCVHVTYR